MGEGDEFEFSYSTDGGANWTTAFTVASIDPANLQSALLPASTNGVVTVRVTDTDSTEGAREADTVFIDD